MAHTATNTTQAPHVSLRAVFGAAMRGLNALMERDPRMGQLRQLGERSDADLAAQGKSRQQELRRILNGSWY
ncbi:hypothetical protein [Pseudoroseicyclus aestuarii]|uniref:DUF1127 domain-containing protein n=1 Tax=Pseudoroseicyclus aestuarii TaxID=1795041 RepID=A0A318SQZ8_9RHOB|nr:hypothetical protein [Pseudoroseicyclus aestuarii]PYE84093.1 hypothetical protein DFP88_103459 [Pseudoroseicyclus aestuarii]